jgi:hypothetical protein
MARKLHRPPTLVVWEVELEGPNTVHVEQPFAAMEPPLVTPQFAWTAFLT